MTTAAATATQEAATGLVSLTIDGSRVAAASGTTVLEAARAGGVYIPTLCHEPDLRPYGGCRVCVVEIDKMRGLPASCTTPVQDGMIVHTETPAVNKSRITTLELIMASHNGDCLTCRKNQQCELQKVARYLGIEQGHFGRLHRKAGLVAVDDSHPGFVRDPNKCILCTRCVRACHEIAGVGAIDIAFRGSAASVSTFGNRPIRQSICESCGECVARCPTGALSIKSARQPTHEVRTLCPYCGVGCSVYLGVRGNEIVNVRGDGESPVNKGGLCVKGRFGLDFVTHPDRLTKPLIRRGGMRKAVDASGDVKEVFREATWDEALDLVAARFAEARRRWGADSLGVLSSAKFTNEESYLVQKFTRAVLGTNNIDHCARLCHASTMVAAIAAFGEGAMSNSVADIDEADLIFVIGSNTTDCHPMIGRIVRQRVMSGHSTLIVADPRPVELSRLAAVHLCHKPGSDVALLNAMMHVIVREDLHDKAFITERTEDFAGLAGTVKRYTPEMAAEVTGVRPADIVRAARLFAGARRAVVVYGMGITQHTTGTDNVKSLANLLLLTGNVGREGTGFSPLRGQNNVQGSCDMGALPNWLPGYQRLADPEARNKFGLAWKCDVKEKTGLTVTELIEGAARGEVRAMYVIGENPVMSEPYTAHTRRGLQHLDFLVVQDIFPTETAILADVVLPAAAYAEKDGTFTSTERRVQKLNKAIEPPGEARPDWQIVSDLAGKMGSPFDYGSTGEIMEEIASLVPIYGGIHHDRLNGYGLQWPCPDLAHPGTPILHRGQFTRGRGRFHAVEHRPPAEVVSVDFPLVLTTGRVLEHWHTGSMSRRSQVLSSLCPSGRVDIHPDDALKLGIAEGDRVNISSDRGKIETEAHVTEKTSPGLAFMAFHWRESSVNVLTNTALDPLAKIPEFKVSAVRAVLTVLDRAAADNAFFSRLAENPHEALREYDLTAEERAAIATGDINRIESWTGKLDERLKKWLIARLQQEKW